MIGGLQIVSIGVVGEHVGKIYMEVKRRPRFIIEEQHGEGTCSQTSLGRRLKSNKFSPARSNLSQALGW